MHQAPWFLIVVICTLAGLAALVGRLLLRAWSLRQLKVLARESYAIRRCWSLLDQLPAELLTQPLRMTFGKIMYVRLKRARKIRHHPGRPQPPSEPQGQGRRHAGAGRA